MSSLRDGIVNFCVDYDSGDAAPQSLQEMLSNRTAGSRPVGAPFSVTLDVAALNKTGGQKFVRSNDTDTFDTLLYESGTLYFNASLPTDLSARQVANIFIEYDIELKTPQVKLSSSTAQIPKPNSAKFASSTPTATPVNKKTGEATSVPLGELINDMVGNNVTEYVSNSLQNYANTVIGGTGNNIIPNLVNVASQAFRVADISTPYTVDPAGTLPIHIEFSFLQTGYFAFQIVLVRNNPNDHSPFFVDNVVMETDANYAVANVTFADLYIIGSNDKVFGRVVYDFCVDVKTVNDIFTIRQLYRPNVAYPAETTMEYKLCAVSMTPLSNEDFSYQAVLSNELVAVSGLRRMKALAFVDGDIHGLHSEVKILDDHKFMAFDKSTPTSLGKYRSVIEDYIPTAQPFSSSRR